MLTVDLSGISSFNVSKEYEAFIGKLGAAHDTLENGTGLGADFLGWLRLPENYDKSEFARIEAAAAKIRSDSKALVVIGIGGSYLGARAAIEYLRSPNYNLIKKDTPDIYFVGNNLSAAYIEEIAGLLEGRDFSINIISKSGTTTEPAVAFRVFKKLLEDRYGREGARARIYATTDAKRGALKEFATKEGYESFVIPDDVGGRFSVLTPVGLLPIAVSGADIGKIMSGARAGMERMRARGAENPAWQYAAARNALFGKGKTTEILACYEPSFRFMTEWWKQLYGESEGKNQTGIFPAGVDFTADLHSMGQFIQQGTRNLFETVVNIQNPRGKVTVPFDEENVDGLNFLAESSLHAINGRAYQGTLLAHIDGGVPNIVVNTPAAAEAEYGEMVYFFEIACGLSGYLLGVNPFDQPGVEAYKKNMFALLGKPGYEELRAQLLDRLGK